MTRWNIIRNNRTQRQFGRIDSEVGLSRPEHWLLVSRLNPGLDSRSVKSGCTVLIKNFSDASRPIAPSAGIARLPIAPPSGGDEEVGSGSRLVTLDSGREKPRGSLAFASPSRGSQRSVLPLQCLRSRLAPFPPALIRPRPGLSRSDHWRSAPRSGSSCSVPGPKPGGRTPFRPASPAADRRLPVTPKGQSSGCPSGRSRWGGGQPTRQRMATSTPAAGPFSRVTRDFGSLELHRCGSCHTPPV